MGLTKGSDNLTYLEAKNGALILTRKTGVVDGKAQYEKESFKELTGKLVKIWKGEKVYEGNKTPKVFIHIQDGDQLYSLMWTEESLFTYGFGAQILGVDLDQPFTIQAWNYGKDSRATFCSLYQGRGGEGGKLELDPNFRRPVTEEKRGKKTTNYDGMLEDWDSVYATLREKLGLEAEEGDANRFKDDNDDAPALEDNISFYNISF